MSVLTPHSCAVCTFGHEFVSKDHCAICHRHYQYLYRKNRAQKSYHVFDPSNNRGRISLLRLTGIHLQIIENKRAKTWTVFPRLVASNPDCFECGRRRKFALVSRTRVKIPTVHLRFPLHQGFRKEATGDKPVEYALGTCLHDTFEDFNQAASLAFFEFTCHCPIWCKHGITLNYLFYKYGLCRECAFKSLEDWTDKIRTDD